MSSVVPLTEDCFERFVESLIELSPSERDQALAGFDSERQKKAGLFLLIKDGGAMVWIDENGLIEIVLRSEEGDA